MQQTQWATAGDGVMQALAFGLVIVLVTVVGTGLVLWKVVLRDRFKRSALLKSGIAARGVVLGVRDTGAWINRQPICELRIRVEPAGAPPFEVQVRQVISIVQLPQFQPGATLTVRYDPANPQEAAVESLGHAGMSPSPGGMPQGFMGAMGAPSSLPSPADAQQALMASQALLQRLNAPGGGVKAGAIVLAFHETGVQVNGDNPMAYVDVKVMPAGGAPFDARVTGVFGRSGLHRYQPGREIGVVYDPSDARQIALDMAWMQASAS